MGQKVNPILFRLGSEKKDSPLYLSSPAQKPHFSHILHQEIECKKFLYSLLQSRGILPRHCTISRTPEKLFLSLDLYFTSLFFQRSKLFWVRSLFKNMKKKYTSLKKVKNLKQFLVNSQYLSHSFEKKQKSSFWLRKDKFLSKTEKREKLFYNKVKKSKTKIKKSKIKNFSLVYKRRLFYFLLYQKKKNILVQKKEKTAVYSFSQNHLKAKFPFVKMNMLKFNRFFGLRRLKYDFSDLFLKNFVGLKRKESQNLLELNKFLCQSFQNYLGIEEVCIKFYSTQLLVLPSFKIYRKLFLRELLSYQKNRDFKKYFLESLELVYFVHRSFGKGNAFLLAKFLSYLLEKNRKQMFIVKFLKKCLELFFKKLPKSFFAIQGIRILIKGRFNKRRRTRKMIVQEGQVSLQTLDTPIDYFQTQAITIYGSFGIKVWIAKRKNS